MPIYDPNVDPATADYEFMGPHGAKLLQQMDQVDDEFWGPNGPPEWAQVAPSGAQEAAKQAPEAKTPEPQQEPSEELSDVPEEEVEEVADDYLESDQNQYFIEQYGRETTDKVYNLLNDTLDEEQLAAFLDGGDYAKEAFDWGHHALQAGATPTAGLTFSQFDEAEEQALRSNSEYADDLLSLNAAVLTGQLSQQQMYGIVAQQPELLHEAIRLRKAGIINF